jgi:hypothetical protein
MKNVLKMSMGAFALSSVLLFAACGETKDEKTTTETTAGEHAHTYACPMHPEVTGKEGDTCPKCGMKLEHNDNPAGTGKNYFMLFSSTPATVEPNKEVTLSFTPKVKENESEQVALDVEHEKKIHLIVVSEDLSWFDHIHPEYNADGSYTVKTKFPAGGKYKLFADYKPTGANHVVDKIDVNVSGAAPAAKTYTADKLTGNAGDGFTVTLTPAGGKFVTGVPMHIGGVVKQNGKEVDPATLENYLGAKAHMVVISMNDKEYLHVHPGVEGAKFDLHTTFEKAGIYRGWIQFQSKGKVYTVDFVMNVTEATEEDKKNAASAHTSVHGDSNGDEHKH